MSATWRQRLTGLFILASLAVLLGTRGLAADSSAEARARASEERMRQDLTFLASDVCEGRGPTTEGQKLAAQYIADQLRKAGLKPGGKEGTYFQPFPVPGATLQGPARLVLRGPQGQTVELTPGEHFHPMGLSAAGSVVAPLVFAGYGITRPKDPAYDDYRGLDVTGKVVVVLRDTPRPDNRTAPFISGFGRQNVASFTAKIQTAEKYGAAAILFVNDYDTARDGDDLLDFNFLAAARSSAKIPIFHVRRSVLEKMLDTSLSQLEQDIDRELQPQSRPLQGWTADLAVNVNRGTLTLRNVVGVLEGSGPLADETVVIGAHYDHLGYGGAFGSLSNLKKMAIHHGADDNASGTTMVLELARRCALNPQREGRRLVFILFSGEEMGLLGSAHYCKEPLFPLEKTAAMFNLDMVGRLRPDPKTGKDRLLLEGTGTAAVFNEMLDTLNQKYDFQMQKKASGNGPSDHMSFNLKKIPVIFFWTDYHPEYHRPTDTAEKINIPGMRKLTDFAEEIILYLATLPQRPPYVQVAGGSGGSPGRVDVPRIGFTPGSYAEEDSGVLIAEVTPGGPAAKGGLKGGDRIVEIAGKPVRNMTGYMTEMGKQKKGEPIEFVIIRDGKKLTVQVTGE